MQTSPVLYKTRRRQAGCKQTHDPPVVGSATCTATEPDQFGLGQSDPSQSFSLWCGVRPPRVLAAPIITHPSLLGPTNSLSLSLSRCSRKNPNCVAVLAASPPRPRRALSRRRCLDDEEVSPYASPLCCSSCSLLRFVVL